MMKLWEIILVSVGLSLEAFTIAIEKGANQKQLQRHMLFFISLFFGGVQTLMLALGLAIGIVPMRYLKHAIILEANQWIAALILMVLGLKMLRRARKTIEVEERLEANMSYKEGAILAARTGMDAILLGVVFGFLGTAVSSVYITFIIVSLFVGLGLWMGEQLGNKYQSLIDVCSGLILVIMSVEVIISFFKVI